MTTRNNFTTAYVCHAMGYAHEDEPAPCIWDFITDEPVEDEELGALSVEAAIAEWMLEAETNDNQ